MFRKTVAASIVAVWLGLIGIEFSEAAGLINRADRDKSVETETASFGVAFQVLDGSRLTISPVLTVHSHVFDTITDLSLSTLHVAAYPRKEARFLQGRFKIYKVHRVLLI
jgi:hypothetical protein